MHTLLLVLILSSGTVSVLDVPVSTHNHTISSDGEQTAQQAAGSAIAKGARYVIITDHLEMIDMAEGELDFFSRWGTKLSGLKTKQVGREAWAIALKQAGLNIVLPGGEVGLGPATVLGGRDLSQRFSHFGVIGGEAPACIEAGGLYDQLIKLAEGQDAVKDMSCAQATLNKMIELSHAAGAIVVVHHPLDSLYPALLGVGRCDAVEFFNGGLELTSDTPFHQFCYLLAVSKVYNKAYGATSGGDWHGPIVDALATEREKARAIALGGLRFDQLDRLTIVRANDESMPAVCAALRQGAYYGVCGNGRIKSMTTWPGEHIAADATLKVGFTDLNRLYGAFVVFGYVAAAGGPIRQKVVPIPLGDKPELSLDLAELVKPEDKQGGYLYLLVANQLVTSAIYVDPLPEPKPATTTPLPDIQGAWVGPGTRPNGTVVCSVRMVIAKVEEGYSLSTTYNFLDGHVGSTNSIATLQPDGTIQRVEKVGISGGTWSQKATCRLRPDGCIEFKGDDSQGIYFVLKRQ